MSTLPIDLNNSSPRCVAPPARAGRHSRRAWRGRAPAVRPRPGGRSGHPSSIRLMPTGATATKSVRVVGRVLVERGGDRGGSVGPAPHAPSGGAWRPRRGDLAVGAGGSTDGATQALGDAGRDQASGRSLCRWKSTTKSAAACREIHCLCRLGERRQGTEGGVANIGMRRPVGSGRKNRRAPRFIGRALRSVEGARSKNQRLPAMSASCADSPGAYADLLSRIWPRR